MVPLLDGGGGQAECTGLLGLLTLVVGEDSGVVAGVLAVASHGFNEIVIEVA